MIILAGVHCKKYCSFHDYCRVLFIAYIDRAYQGLFYWYLTFEKIPIFKKDTTKKLNSSKPTPFWIS